MSENAGEYALTELLARDALEEHVRGSRWLRGGIASDLEFVEVVDASAYHLSLQSFTESRSVSTGARPYYGGEVDGPGNGTPPEPSEIPVPVAEAFIDRVMHYEIPHTADVAVCNRCEGSGHAKCESCGGRGGIGCSACSGSGRARCSRCAGSGSVIEFRQLDVTWATVSTAVELPAAELPSGQIERGNGMLAHAEVAERIEARPANTPYRSDGRVRVSERVERAIATLVANHREPANARLHQQKLVVRAVSVGRVTYRWGRGAPRRFFVIGTNRAVYAPQFPRALAITAAPWLAGIAATAAALAWRFL